MSHAVLNTRQAEAVEATEGRVRVVAGAGSGKTRVLAHRFAYLVNDIGVSPGNILCLTFTNKAAQEMKRRIASMVDGGSVNDFVCTIHSFCVKFLRREIYRIGYPKNFLIVDEEDCKALAKQAMQDFGIDRKRTTAERFLKQVAAFKGADPEGYISRWLLPGAPSEAVDAVTRYMRLQLKQYALDFDDLLCFTVYILNHFDEARAYWTDMLNYVMVDEAQDCSDDDWRLLNILPERHGNMFIVGDPDQAIYEWRGANPRIFVNWRPQTDIILDENYRSTPDVLNVANAVIEHNKNRIPKELYTRRLNERAVVYHHFKDEKEEARVIAEEIARGLREGADASDYAVLYRASFISRRIEQALLKLKIDYSVWGGIRFFERREIKDVIAYLRLIASDSDDLAFMRVINLPSRKFGSVSLEQLRRLAADRDKSLMATLREVSGDKPFNRPQLLEFIDIIDEARDMSRHMPVSELTDWLLNRTGLGDLYRTDEEEERLENIAELVNSMKEFEETRFELGERDLTAYLHEIALYTNTDHHDKSPKVRIMTIHQSKGLEFSHVFVMGLTEGIFPSHRSIRERRKDGEEEERRLMYVAVTRAKDVLWLTESEGYMNDTGALKFPSRFIAEIPPEHLEVHGNPDPDLLEGTRRMAAQLSAELGDTQEVFMQPGTRVSHRVFGEGVIESVDKSSGVYRVRFGETVRNLVGRVLTPMHD